MSGYTTREVAELIGVTPAKVRAFARAGFVARAARRGHYRFTLPGHRAAARGEGARDAQIHPRKVRRALRALRDALPAHRSLSGLRISAAGDEVVVQDAHSAWQPETGQVTFDFTIAELVGDAAPVVLAAVERAAAEAADEADAEEWLALALDLETVGVIDEARARLRARARRRRGARAGAHQPRPPPSLAESPRATPRRTTGARSTSEPGNATALFNLGVALEDGKRFEEAIAVYERAAAADDAVAGCTLQSRPPLRADAATSPRAIRHFARYRALLR